MLFHLAIFTGECNIMSMESTLWNGVNENRTSISHVMSCSLQVSGISGQISSIMFHFYWQNSAVLIPLHLLYSGQPVVPHFCEIMNYCDNSICDKTESRLFKRLLQVCTEPGRSPPPGENTSVLTMCFSTLLSQEQSPSPLMLSVTLSLQTHRFLSLKLTIAQVKVLNLRSPLKEKMEEKRTNFRKEQISD